MKKIGRPKGKTDKWKDRLPRIRYMASYGCTAQEIAEVYNCHERRIVQICKENNISLFGNSGRMKEPMKFELKPINTTTYTENGINITLCDQGHDWGAEDRYTAKPRGKK